MSWVESGLSEARWIIDALEASARRRARMKFAHRGTLRLIPVLEVTQPGLRRARRRRSRLIRRLAILLPRGHRKLALRISRHAYRSEQAGLAAALVEACHEQTRYIDFTAAEHQRQLDHAKRQTLERIEASLRMDAPDRPNADSGH